MIAKQHYDELFLRRLQEPAAAPTRPARPWNAGDEGVGSGNSSSECNQN